MKRCKVCLLVVFMFFSCQNNYNVKKEVIRLKSMPIKLYIGDLQFFVNGKDSIPVNSEKDSSMKLIIYYDSVSCTPCIIDKMYIWDDIINYSSKFYEKLRIYFIFHPSNNGFNTLNLAFENNKIDYPIFVDKTGSFERLNPHLPKNKALHTFLLDENNKVILVGNPLSNKEIEKIFYKKTQELLSK